MTYNNCKYIHCNKKKEMDDCLAVVVNNAVFYIVRPSTVLECKFANCTRRVSRVWALSFSSYRFPFASKTPCKSYGGITGETDGTEKRTGPDRILDTPNIWNFALRSINTAAVSYADHSTPLPASLYRRSISFRSESHSNSVKERRRRRKYTRPGYCRR